jgi:hypothetical protein
MTQTDLRFMPFTAVFDRLNFRAGNTYNLQKLYLFFLLSVFTSFVYCSEYKIIAFLNDVKQWQYAVKAVSILVGYI